MTDLPADLAHAGWQVTDDGKAIERRFTFDSFSSAIGWMVRAAFVAEAMDHHPNWTNVYDRVDVRLTSHDVGGITDRDYDLARRLTALT